MKFEDVIHSLLERKKIARVNWEGKRYIFLDEFNDIMLYNLQTDINQLYHIDFVDLSSDWYVIDEDRKQQNAVDLFFDVCQARRCQVSNGELSEIDYKKIIKHLTNDFLLNNSEERTEIISIGEWFLNVFE